MQNPQPLGIFTWYPTERRHPAVGDLGTPGPGLGPPCMSSRAHPKTEERKPGHRVPLWHAHQGAARGLSERPPFRRCLSIHSEHQCLSHCGRGTSGKARWVGWGTSIHVYKMRQSSDAPAPGRRETTSLGRLHARFVGGRNDVEGCGSTAQSCIHCVCRACIL